MDSHRARLAAADPEIFAAIAGEERRQPPMRPSGVRVGTPACTTRGMGIAEMQAIAGCMLEALRRPDDQQALEGLHARVRELALRFPVPGIEAPSV
jgi:glycine hydroxymethyltransferase